MNWNSKRDDILGVLDEIQRYDFIHQERIDGIRFSPDLGKWASRPVWEIQTLAIINCLVRHGTMLLYGPHGGGKTSIVKVLGKRLFGYTDDEVERGMLRGHPQLTEEKIIGSLKIEQLLRPEERVDGRIGVNWSGFATEHWKMIDEVNRMNPYARDVVLSLLAEGRLKYHDQTSNCANFSLFATMNPRDEGTVELPLPFRDRFGIAVRVSMPDWRSWNVIGLHDKRTAQETFGNSCLDKEQLYDLQGWIAETIAVDPEAESLANQFLSEYQNCARTNKELNENLHVDNGLCKGCHWKTQGLVCSKVRHPLSVRAKEDMMRYGRALAWFLGYSQVNAEHIAAMAPYCIWHRTAYSGEYMNDRLLPEAEKAAEPSKTSKHILKDQFRATRQIVFLINERYQARVPVLGKPLLYTSDADRAALKGRLETSSKVDLFLSQVNDYLVRNEQFIKKAAEYWCQIQDSINDAEKLAQLREEIEPQYELHDYQRLLDEIARRYASRTAKVFSAEINAQGLDRLLSKMSAYDVISRRLLSAKDLRSNGSMTVAQKGDQAEFKKGLRDGVPYWAVNLRGPASSDLWKWITDCATGNQS